MDIIKPSQNNFHSDTMISEMQNESACKIIHATAVFQPWYMWWIQQVKLLISAMYGWKNRATRGMRYWGEKRQALLSASTERSGERAATYAQVVLVEVIESNRPWLSINTRTTRHTVRSAYHPAPQRLPYVLSNHHPSLSWSCLLRRNHTTSRFATHQRWKAIGLLICSSQ